LISDGPARQKSVAARDNDARVGKANAVIFTPKWRKTATFGKNPDEIHQSEERLFALKCVFFRSLL
jgi:hypothetical protein